MLKETTVRQTMTSVSKEDTIDGKVTKFAFDDEVSNGRNCCDQGKHYEVEVEKMLKELNVPYKKNIKFMQKVAEKPINRGSAMMEIDFIIPMGIIEVKSFTQWRQGKRTQNFIKQLEMREKFVPSQFTIYVYLISDDDVDMTEFKFSDRVKFIRNVSEIDFTEPTYTTMDTAVIRSLASTENTNHKKLLDKYKGRIHITKTLFDTSSVIMNDAEIKTLNEYDINIDDNKSIPLCAVQLTSHRPQQSRFVDYTDVGVFFDFSEHVQSFSLDQGKPMRYIDGITKKCQTCDSIVWVKFTKCPVCIKQ